MVDGWKSRYGAEGGLDAIEVGNDVAAMASDFVFETLTFEVMRPAVASTMASNVLEFRRPT